MGSLSGTELEGALGIVEELGIPGLVELGIPGIGELGIPGLVELGIPGLVELGTPGIVELGVVEEKGLLGSVGRVVP